MGWCYEFGRQVGTACDHPMVAGERACHCPHCGVTCRGQFAGCQHVWAVGPPRLTPPPVQAHLPVGGPTEARNCAGPKPPPSSSPPIGTPSVVPSFGVEVHRPILRDGLSPEIVAVLHQEVRRMTAEVHDSHQMLLSYLQRIEVRQQRLEQELDGGLGQSRLNGSSPDPSMLEASIPETSGPVRQAPHRHSRSARSGGIWRRDAG